MSEMTGNSFVFNDRIYSRAEFANVEKQMDDIPIVYEVIRVEEKVPLFFEDYLQRLQNSYSLLQQKMPVAATRIISTVHELIRVNDHRSGPVKLVFGLGDDPFFLSYLMKAHLPMPEEYKSGVKTITMRASRQNPNLKIWNAELRQSSVTLMENENAYEAILLNPDGTITEASRSNVFFIKGNTVFTTPADLVLPGITRKKVLEVCEENQIGVALKIINIDAIHQYDSCFLTGTARKIVPIQSVDDIAFKVDTPMLRNVSNLFEEFVRAYLASHH